MLDSLGRHKRWTGRNPQGDPPKITSRVLDIFELIERHGYATSKYIHRILGRDWHTLQTLLGNLYDWGYIERFEEQRSSFPNRIRHIIYGNEQKAREELIKAGREASLIHRYDPFHHRFAAASVGISLEGMSPASNLKYISRNLVLKGKSLRIHLPDFGPKAYYEPDDLSGFQHQDKSFRRHPLELDRSNEPLKGKNRNSSLDKKLDYIEYIIKHQLYLEAWGIPGGVWLFVLTSNERLNNFFDLVRERNNSALSSRILGKSYPIFGNDSYNWLVPDDLLTDILEPWRCADGSIRDITVA